MLNAEDLPEEPEAAQRAPNKVVRLIRQKVKIPKPLKKPQDAKRTNTRDQQGKDKDSSRGKKHPHDPALDHCIEQYQQVITEALDSKSALYSASITACARASVASSTA